MPKGVGYGPTRKSLKKTRKDGTKKVVVPRGSNTPSGAMRPKRGKSKILKVPGNTWLKASK